MGIRYFNCVKIDPQAFKNMVAFCKSKKKSAPIFDKISTGSLNRYLKELMPDLSAKVFRTYNASMTLEKELNKIVENNINRQSPVDVATYYDTCNRAVAILCNHQRSVPKQHAASMEKMAGQVVEIEEDIAEVESYITAIKAGKRWKPKNPEPLEGVDGKLRKPAVKDGMLEQQAVRRLHQLKTKKSNLEHKMRVKDDNKEVALNTSKINYMDPRITVAYCKKHELTVEKVFGKALRDKFPWAMYAKEDFVF